MAVLFYPGLYLHVGFRFVFGSLHGLGWDPPVPREGGRCCSSRANGTKLQDRLSPPLGDVGGRGGRGGERDAIWQKRKAEHHTDADKSLETWVTPAHGPTQNQAAATWKRNVRSRDRNKLSHWAGITQAQNVTELRPSPLAGTQVQAQSWAAERRFLSAHCCVLWSLSPPRAGSSACHCSPPACKQLRSSLPSLTVLWGAQVSLLQGCSAPPPPSARACCCCSHPCSCCLVLQLMGRVTALVSPPLQPVWRLPPNQPEEAGDATEVTLFSHPPCCFRQS